MNNEARAKWKRVKGSKIFTKLCFTFSPYFTNWVGGQWPRELAGKSSGNSPKISVFGEGSEKSFLSILFTLNVTVVLFIWLSFQITLFISSSESLNQEFIENFPFVGNAKWTMIWWWQRSRWYVISLFHVSVSSSAYVQYIHLEHS